MNKSDTHISKFLSLVLRHQPEKIGIQLDENGWVDVDVLLEQLNKHNVTIDRNLLNHIVETNPKKRFAFNESQDKIRASQGHSIEIELGYTNQQPPEFLFHGTSENVAQSILQSGIEKRSRQHVHLSSDYNTAIQVGKRHGKPIVFQVAAQQMFADNFEFYISENGVWLTVFVPTKYLSINSK